METKAAQLNREKSIEKVIEAFQIQERLTFSSLFDTEKQRQRQEKIHNGLELLRKLLDFYFTDNELAEIPALLEHKKALKEKGDKLLERARDLANGLLDKDYSGVDDILKLTEERRRLGEDVTQLHNETEQVDERLSSMCNFFELVIESIRLSIFEAFENGKNQYPEHDLFLVPLNPNIQ